MELVFIGAGSNLGNRKGHILSAEDALSRYLTNLKRSRIYETLPRYEVNQPRYLNTVFFGDCESEPDELLVRLQEIENDAGRDREKAGWMGPRPLDLDILLFGERIIHTPKLTVPHSLMNERAFVLIPLLELRPLLREPGSSTAYLDFAEKLPRQGIYYHTVKPL